MANSNVDVKRLVFSILKFLHKQRADHSGEALEQIEVAQQFLESAYGFTLDDAAASAQYDVPQNLLDIFVDAAGPALPSGEHIEKQKAKAEEKKTRGNELMKAEKYQEALAAYTDAISLNNQNAVYFCNRAAAHSKIGSHQSAIDDCVQAIEIDPTYSKAYGRMGLAYSALNKHQEATQHYKKALELDPANDSYKNNLKIAEEKSKDGSPTAPPNPLADLNSPLGNLGSLFGGPGGPGGGQMPDMTSLLSNPGLMSMATQMMQNPEVQNLMTNLMTGGGGAGGTPDMNGMPGLPPGGMPPGGMPPGGMGPGGMDNLLQAGQQLAQQLHASNPELVEQLRQQMGGANRDNSGNPPPGDDANQNEK